MTYTLQGVDSNGETKQIAKGRFEEVTERVEMTVSASELKEASALRVSVTYFPCQTGSEGICRIATISWQVPVSIGPDGVERIELDP